MSFPHALRLWLVSAAALSILAVDGVAAGVSWLPDSSGFICSNGRQLIHYDVAAKAKKILVANTDAFTLWPALDADGKTIALARVYQPAQGDATLQLIFVDRDGKELKRSSNFPWPRRLGPKDPVIEGLWPARLFWGPDGTRLLVESERRIGIVDLANDKFFALPPQLGVPVIFGNSPFHADGQHFLTTNHVWLTLDGKDLRRVPVDVMKGRDYKLLLDTGLGSGRDNKTWCWDRDLNFFEFDAKKTRMSLAGIGPLTDAFEPILQTFEFPKSKKLVRQVLEDKSLRRRLEQDIEAFTLRLEWVEAGKATSTLARQEIDAELFFPSFERQKSAFAQPLPVTIQPAPNEALAVLNVAVPPSGSSVLVVNDRGEKLDAFELAAPFPMVRPIVRSQPLAFSLEFSVDAEPNQRVFLTTLMPRDRPGQQKILKMNVSPAPAKGPFEEFDNHYATFVVSGRRTIKIDVEAEIYAFDLDSAAAPARREDVKPYLIHEPYLEKDAKEIQKAAAALEGKDDIEVLRSIMDFVLRWMKPAPYDRKDRGALHALETRQGDATEFADLFVALCRARGIPARVCEGYLPSTKDVDTPRHQWVEAYTEKIGWMSFDPYQVSQGKATFERMPPRLCLSTLRSDARLSYYHYWAYRFEGAGTASVESAYTVREASKE